LGPQPNTIAYLALLAWPVVVLLLFLRFRPDTATALAILGGVLVLPAGVEFDYVGLPPLDRISISCLSALLAFLLLHPGRIQRLRPGTGVELFAVVLVLSSFATARTNPDGLYYGGVAVPGMSLGDGVSLASDNVLTVWLPFFLGRWLFRRPEQIRRLLAILAGVMLVYSLPILYELRMSPQLHRLVYGFHQHDFHQTMRGGGWRPMVFTAHGLVAAQYVLLGTAAALALWRSGRSVLGLPALPLAAWLGVLLVAMKSLGALVYAAWLLPTIAWLRPRWQLYLASLLVGLVFSYPIARAAGLVPVDALVSGAKRVSSERSQSLAFRLEHEGALLERALERPWLGWGLFGRNRLRDAMTGKDISVTDGYWVIALGKQGIVGFVCNFGLALFPVWIAAYQQRRVRRGRSRRWLAALACIVAVGGLNLLPNAQFDPVFLLCSGALLGVAEAARASSAAPARSRWRRGRRIGRSGPRRSDPDRTGDAGAEQLS